MVETRAPEPVDESAATPWRRRESARGADIWRASFLILLAGAAYLWVTGQNERRDTLRAICEPVMAWYERQHDALDLPTRARFSEVADRCLNSGVSQPPR